jgi:predicted metal-dependent phosphoesterase TrpH
MRRGKRRPRSGIAFVPGVELSADGPPGKCHLLGLNIDPDHAPLRDTLARVSEARRTRNARIAERLRALGAPVTLDEVTAVAPPGANVGRPHFAQTLLARGFVSTLAEAFERFLADTAPAYVPAGSLSPAEAIALIHEAGGLTFLAHPGLLKLSPGERIRERLVVLKTLGLDGVEAYYGKHTLPQIERFLELARDLNLLVTGGSDFHGANKPDVVLGDVWDGRGVPFGWLPPALLAGAAAT